MGKEVEYSGRIRAKVEVRLTGRETERFIRLCGRNGIELRKLCREEEGKGYRFVIWGDEFFMLRPYLKKTKCRARVIEKEGLPFYLKRRKRRLLFPAGILFGTMFLFSLSQFIWRIDIEGNTCYTDDVIYRFLEEQQIKFGTLKASVYAAGLEEEIRNHFEEITWVSVQLEGTHMTVNLKENDQLSAEVLENDPVHLVSEMDGIITSIVVRAGQTSLKEGDLVSAGQILISGVVELKDDGGNITDFKEVHADGEVFASASYQYEDSFLLSHEHREYYEDCAAEYALVLGNYRISLPFVIGERGKYYDAVTQRNQLYLGSDYYLPVHVEKTEYRSYTRRVEEYQQEEIFQVASERMQQFLEKLGDEGYEICDRDMTVTLRNGICYVTGTYRAISQIGKEERIYTDDA